MRWRAHTRTAEKVLESFDALYFKKYEQELINGIISPDNEDQKPHHIGREQTALDYIVRARKKRLIYDTGGCFFQLGVAFHYIQDMWVGVDPEFEDHLAYLDRINKCEILQKHESLESYFPVRRRRILEQFRGLEKRLSKPLGSESELKEIVLMRRPYENSAFLDLNLSFRVCYRVAEMVLKTMYNVQLQESLDLLKNKYIERIKNRELQEAKRIDDLILEEEQYSSDDSAVGKINHWRLDKSLKDVIRSYESREHLKPLITSFEKEVEDMCLPHENWYNIDKPTISLDILLGPTEFKEEEVVENDSIFEKVIIQNISSLKKIGSEPLTKLFRSLKYQTSY